MLAGIGLIAIAAFAASRGITQRVDPETPIVAAAAAAPMPPETIAMAGTSSASAPVVDARRHDDVGTAGHVARQAIVPSKTAAPTSAAIRSVDKPAAATPDKTTAGSPETAGDARDRSSVDASPTVTIAGCVERDRKAFWLKSVSGDDVPRTRSWRSGFFKKRASSVSLMDATDGVGLEGYVGQRVAATGRLVNGELRAVALQQLAGSCGGN